MSRYTFMWSSTPTLPNYWGTALALRDRHDVFPTAALFQYYDGSVITAYMREEDLERFRSEESPKYLDPTFLAAYEANYQRELETWWMWIRRVERTDYATASPDVLRADHKQFAEYMRDAIAYFGSTRPEFTFTSERELLIILERHLGSEASKAFEALATSREHDEVQKEEMAWEALENRDEAALLAHLSRFPWLVFGQFDEQKAFAFLRGREARPESDLTKRKTELVATQDSILSQLSDDEERARYLAKFLQGQSIRRLEIKSYWAGCYFLARQFWKRLAADLSAPLEDLIAFISPPEIEESLDQSHDLKKTIEGRRRAYAIDYIPGSDIRMVEANAAQTLFQERISAPTNQTTFKGQVASSGQYTGRVRKVVAGDLDMLQQSTKDFQKGEVLVTSMTQPNMMVIARKAGAIVTDEGGITSHAAVISRELGIPCIVGCHTAMQNLMNGDEVEVDATKGIVRKI